MLRDLELRAGGRVEGGIERYDAGLPTGAKEQIQGVEYAPESPLEGVIDSTTARG